MNPNAITNIIGLDTDKVPVRLIYACSDNEDRAVPYVLESRNFKTVAGLSAYWRRYYANRPNLRVAVPANSPDPLGVIPWLEKHNVTVERYSWLAYRCHLNGDFTIWGLPKVFERAYTLALYAAYRLHGLSVARLLWARTFEVQEMLTEMRHELHRLSAALPKSGTAQYTIPEELAVPF